MNCQKGNVVKISEEFEWKILEFFSLNLETGAYCYSPVFSYSGELWYFYCYPNRISYGSEECIGLFLSRHSTGSPINLKFSMYIKSLKGEKIKEKYTYNNFKAERDNYGWSFFMPRSDLIAQKSELLPSDVLTIICTMECSKSAENKSDNVTTQCSYCKNTLDPGNVSSHEKKCLDKPIKCPECSDVIVLRSWYEHECQKTKPKGEPSTSVSSQVLRDFRDFFLKKENCDVILNVQRQQFQAHKAILEARSSVLASAFRNDMKEKATGVVDIKDCDPSSFSDFICFLYCGDTDVISKENVFSLFTAADKYDVQDLRKTCMEFMKENLSVDTFCETITLALRHSEAELIKLMTDFFIENAKDITLTAKWQSFLVENPTESNELIVKFIASK